MVSKNIWIQDAIRGTCVFLYVYNTFLNINGHFCATQLLQYGFSLGETSRKNKLQTFNGHVKFPYYTKREFNPTRSIVTRLSIDIVSVQGRPKSQMFQNYRKPKISTVECIIRVSVLFYKTTLQFS